MIRLLNIRYIPVSLLLIGISLSCAKFQGGSSVPYAQRADTPANAAYFIENEWVKLKNGKTQREAAPGSASIIRISLLQAPLYGDLNYDKHKDAVLFLSYEGGGSGTFTYLAAALQDNIKYQGMNSIFLGDRIGLPTAAVRNGLITVTYLDRGDNEPMATAPSLKRSRYFIVDDLTLREIKTSGDEIFPGWLTIGHEVSSFSPCDGKEDFRLLGNSPALAELIAAYRKTMAGYPPYPPVFVIIAGRKSGSPAAGLDAGHNMAFSASRLIKLLPQGNCRSDFIVLDSPLPGTGISSPLVIKGRARGSWFFEGDFPVLLLDEKNGIIAESYATAKGEWMTEDFVEFEGTITFTGSFSGRRGTLILKKDNPTGLVQFDDSLVIPINFE